MFSLHVKKTENVSFKPEIKNLGLTFIKYTEQIPPNTRDRTFKLNITNQA